MIDKWYLRKNLVIAHVITQSHQLRKHQLRQPMRQTIKFQTIYPAA